MRVLVRIPRGGGFARMTAETGMATECGNKIVGVNGESCKVEDKYSGRTRTCTDVVITLAEAKSHGFDAGAERAAPRRAEKAVEPAASKKGGSKKGSAKKTAHKSNTAKKAGSKAPARKAARAGR